MSRHQKSDEVQEVTMPPLEDEGAPPDDSNAVLPGDLENSAPPTYFCTVCGDELRLGETRDHVMAHQDAEETDENGAIDVLPIEGAG